MKRILLLDDSPNIQKVVRLTFSSVPDCEVSVARNSAEVESAFAAGVPDAIISYVGFVAENTPAYLAGIRERCGNVLLLAESNEDVSPFVQLGLTLVLHKPFVSAKLKSAVLSMWGEVALGDLPPPPPLRAMQADERRLPPPPPPPLRVAQTDEAPHPAAPPPPPPPPLRAEVAPTEPEVAVPRDTFSDNMLRATSFMPPSVPPLSLTNLAGSEASGVTQDLPEITMDVDSLERSFRATLAQEPPEVTFSGDISSVSTSHRSSEDMFGDRSESPSSRGEEGQFSLDLGNNSASGPAPAEADTAAVPAEQGAPLEIDLAALPPDETLTLENVVVHAKAPQRAEPVATPAIPQQWREEMNEAVDDAIFRILDRAVPAKIDSKIEQMLPTLMEGASAKLKADFSDTLRDALLVQMREELAGRLKDEMTKEAAVLRNMLAESMVPDIRGHVVDAVRGWLDSHIHDLAKDAVREEIQKIIADI